MSEKRFIYEEEHYNFPVKKRIRDTQNNETYDLRECCELLNEQQATIQQKDKQLQKAKEYFMDYLSREMSANNFSELWDLVIDDE